MNSSIQTLIENYQELESFLKSQGMISESIDLSDHYRKILLLSCASYYETKITNIIQEFVTKTSNDERVVCFLNNKALNRQYHTLFQWNGNNINNFLGLFGSNYKESVQKKIDDNEELKKYIRAFLNIGNERNKMVHENFLDYQLEKTFDEIVALHNDAIKFIDFLTLTFSN